MNALRRLAARAIRWALTDTDPPPPAAEPVEQCPTCFTDVSKGHLFWCEQPDWLDEPVNVAVVAPWDHDDDLDPGLRAAAIQRFKNHWFFEAVGEEAQP